MNKKIEWIGLTILVVIVVGFAAAIFGQQLIFSPTKTNLEEGVSLSNSSENNTEQKIEVVAEDLDTPWEIVFLEDDSFLVTERPGRLLRIKNGEKINIPISGSVEKGEGGLLGMTKHPRYIENKYLYVYLSAKASQGTINRVERYTFNEEQNTLSDKVVIVDNIPGALYHDGGRIKFGPDGYLYITTGDATIEETAQDLDSLAGKTLRVNEDGDTPEGNPFNTAVYSYGHRNSQGLAWDAEDNLWSTEHGRSGVKSGYDELNKIEKGGNYGWPVIQGPETKEGMISPVAQSGADETWAPADIEIVNDTLYFTGLRGESIYTARIQDGDLQDEIKINLQEDFGRLRTIRKGTDEFLYILTSNKDARGEPRVGDDKIIKIHSSFFE